MQAKIQSEAKEEMSRTQREYFLREQFQALKPELGDLDEGRRRLMSCGTNLLNAGCRRR